MDESKSLRQRCHIVTNEDGDNFVGIKADTGDAFVYFPIGYQLPENDDDLRVDIVNLINVLAYFLKEEKVIETDKFNVRNTVEFPIHAYLTIIREFLRLGRYYIETDSQFKTDTKGRISWAKTLKEQKAIVQKNGSLIFTNMTVRFSSPNSNKKITQIHRYCVYEAFEKLGWLFVSFMPEKPGIHPGVKESIFLLNKKIECTNNDKDLELLSAMKDMLEYMDKNSSDMRLYYGTYIFEKVWEKMIDKAFGIKDITKYMPRTRWLLDYGNNKNKSPLAPDTIMIYNNKYYVIDAKCYRYGWTGNSDHLPNGSDIYKQITYAEYVEKVSNVPNERLYNCFIMPFNKEDNVFNIRDNICNIGEAIGDWKYDSNNPKMKNYERIQGIVMDTRYLMYNYLGASDQLKMQLAECIEKVLSRGLVPPPK